MRITSILFCAFLVGSMSACGGEEDTNNGLAGNGNGTSGNGGTGNGGSGNGGTGNGGTGNGGGTIQDLQDAYCEAQCNFLSSCGIPFPNCESECVSQTADSFVELSAACQAAVTDYTNCLGSLSCMDFATGCQAEIMSAAGACDGA